MKKRIAIIFLSIILTISSTAFAVDDIVVNDFAATWSSLSLKQNFNHGLSLTLRGEYRTKDNLTTTDCHFYRLTASYKPCPYLSMALAYDFLSSQQAATQKNNLFLPSYFKRNHRLLADLQAIYPFRDWTFSLRERYVFAYLMPSCIEALDSAFHPVAIDNPSVITHTLRTMPQVKYHVPNTGWSPYIALEIYNTVQPNKFALAQYHLFAGTSYKVNNCHSFNFFYVLQHKFPSSKRLHTIGIDYIITLPAIPNSK